MFQRRPFIAAALLAACFLVALALSTAPVLSTTETVGTQSCTVYYCPSEDKNFICCPFQGPNCPCDTCPDFCR